MSAFDNVTPFLIGRRPAFSSLRILAAAWASLRRFTRLRQARKDLHGLPDYLLSDIGIDRSQIDNVTAFNGHHQWRG
jgi:Uncharacterized conserved small protein